VGLILAASVTAMGIEAIGRDRAFPARPEQRRPLLLFLTSLPLLFGDDFSLQTSAAPALKRLQSRYRLVPISVTNPADLAKGRILLMAQPRAQTAENLEALDGWVRQGGRLLLLADPLLEWPSRRPLSDLTRPPLMFMDTGLLAHWGLRLDAPDERGVAKRRLARYTIVTVSPGTLHGACKLSSDFLVAQCRIGAGEATIVADADFLDTVRLGSAARNNINGLLAELAELEPK
jgi:hypothetical protein